MYFERMFATCRSYTVVYNPQAQIIKGQVKAVLSLVQMLCRSSKSDHAIPHITC